MLYPRIRLCRQKWVRGILRIMLNMALLMVITSLSTVTYLFMEQNINSRISKDAVLQYNKHVKPFAHEIVNSKNKISESCKLSFESGFRKSIKKCFKKKHKLIILAAVIDKAYLPTAINFYETSINPLNLNELTAFLCVDIEACKKAQGKGLKAFLYYNDTEKPSGAYGTPAFNKKSKYKLRAVYDLLQMGHDVLLTDLDMYYFKSPIPYLKKHCSTDCDMIIQEDSKQSEKTTGYVNTGFYYVKSSRGSLSFFATLLQSMAKSKGNDQDHFNKILRRLAKKENNTNLTYTILPSSLFPNGKVYFEDNRHFYPDQKPDNDYILVHNNWIASLEAKVYRFKEAQMWKIDEDGYYSDPKAKYLLYKNYIIKNGSKADKEKDVLALRSALAIAIATGRILILPRFHRDGREVPLHYFMLISKFNQRFGEMVRESSFLMNSLVPEQVRTNICGTFQISGFRAGNKNKKNLSTKTNPHNTLTPKNKLGATDIEIHRWLKQFSKCPVLSFHYLHGAFYKFENRTKHQQFEESVKRGFKRTNALQLKDLGSYFS